MRTQTRLLLATVVSLMALSGTAAAATVQPPGPTIAPGTLQLSAELTGASSGGTNTDPTLSLPGSYNYGQTFVGPITNIAGTSSSFYDDYVFTVGTSVASSVTTTINLDTLLNITNLQERLYNAATGDVIPYTAAGIPPGATSYFLGWTSPLGTTGGSVAVLQSAALTAGTYVLEIRGNVVGTAGGSYAGVLNVAPVPLPAALPLLLSGLGALGAARRRRKLAAT